MPIQCRVKGAEFLGAATQPDDVCRDLLAAFRAHWPQARALPQKLSLSLRISKRDIRAVASHGSGAKMRSLPETVVAASDHAIASRHIRLMGAALAQQVSTNLR